MLCRSYRGQAATLQLRLRLRCVHVCLSKRATVPTGGYRSEDANARGGEFSRAGKLGQENEHAMQVPIPPGAIFLSSNLPVESQPAVTQRQLPDGCRPPI
jgi:hypothetical protein